MIFSEQIKLFLLRGMLPKAIALCRYNMFDPLKIGDRSDGRHICGIATIRFVCLGNFLKEWILQDLDGSHLAASGCIAE
jgi:hypothetical protein